MARIKITDLPKDFKSRPEDMRNIRGGVKGDFSLYNQFWTRRHYPGVRLQQGRVQLDDDWNE
jgi:hypothetical protein